MKRIVIYLAIVMFFAVFAFAEGENRPPLVYDVHAEQRLGTGFVDITYYVDDPDGDLLTVSLEISNDAGKTFTVNSKKLTGDIGNDISPGKDQKKIVWNVLGDLANVRGANYVIKITAYDRQGNAQTIISKDGMSMELIPAGEFKMGDAFAEGDGDERPVHTVYIDAFYMDIYEVTNAQYALFMNDYVKTNNIKPGRWAFPYNDISKIDCLIEYNSSGYKPKLGYENYPVIDISWYGAQAYAEFYGKVLPTEAEWEKAARGGLIDKRYPWGDTISHDNANYSGKGGKDRWEDKSPVGSFAPNGYGLYDIAGNVSEFCYDFYDDSGYYNYSPKSNPTGPETGIYSVIRGGGYVSNEKGLRVADRWRFDLNWVDNSIGFRCVESHSEYAKAMEHSAPSNIFSLNTMGFDKKPDTMILAGHSSYVESVSFNPDGTLLASGGGDDLVKFWDMSERIEIASFEGHLFSVLSVAFSPDGKLLASGGNDRKMNILNVSTYKSITEMSEAHSGGVNSLSFSPDGRLLASGSSDKTVKLWDMSDPKNPQLEATLANQSYVSSVAFSPDGKLLASGCYNDSVKLWDVSTHQQLAVINTRTNNLASVHCLDFSPNGGFLAIGCEDNKVQLMNVSDPQRPQLVATISRNIPKVYSVNFSPNGNLLAIGGWSDTVRIWDVSDMQNCRGVMQITTGQTRVLSLAFRPKGNMLVTAGQTNSIMIWDIPNYTSLKAGWNMVSFPGTLSNPSVDALIPQGSNIIPPLYTYDPTNSSYKEVSEVKPGEGYWALTVADESLSANIAPVSSLVLNLKPGWNMIGSVFGNVDFSDPQDNPNDSVIPPIYTYNPTSFGYEEKTNIEPNKGYWVLATQDCILTLNSNAAPPRNNVTKAHATKPDWIVPVQVITGKGIKEIVLGVQSVASDSFDPYMDKAMPPKASMVSTQPEASFLIDNSIVSRLSRDIRKNDTNVTWNMEIESNAGTELKWDVSSLPLDRDMILHFAGTETDMRVQNRIKVPSGKHVVMITLKDRIPTKPELLQNYPNPFNPETWIPYQLSEAGVVVISIYDVSGHLVRRLDLGHKEAGIYASREKAVHWDGRNEAGERVSSGVYFYQIRSGRFSKVMKLVVIK